MELLTDFKQIMDNRGLLSILEFSTLPFIPKRMFIRQNIIPNSIIGNHYHKKVEQYIIVLTGICYIEIENKIDNSYNKFILTAGQSYYLKTMQKIKITTDNLDTSILVLCSTAYDPEDCYD